MNENYISKLALQYERETGKSFVSFNDQNFSNWLKQLAYRTALYRKLVGGYAVDITSPYLAEIGKGKYDSVVDPSATVISPYADTLGKEKSELILPDMEIKTEEGIVIPDIDMIMAVNPYDEDSIKEWYKVHNSKKADILIGAHGLKTDKDRKDKEEMIRVVSSKMYDDQAFDIETIEDFYFVILISEREEVMGQKENRGLLFSNR